MHSNPLEEFRGKFYKSFLLNPYLDKYSTEELDEFIRPLIHEVTIFCGKPVNVWYGIRRDNGFSPYMESHCLVEISHLTETILLYQQKKRKRTPNNFSSQILPYTRLSIPTIDDHHLQIFWDPLSQEKLMELIAHFDTVPYQTLGNWADLVDYLSGIFGKPRIIDT